MSPRLGVTFDPRGDGDWIVERELRDLRVGHRQRHRQRRIERRRRRRASTSSISGRRSISTPTRRRWSRSHDALRTLFDWFNANGGTNRPNVGAALPGVNSRVSPDLVVAEHRRDRRRRDQAARAARDGARRRRLPDSTRTSTPSASIPATGQVVQRARPATSTSIITENTNDVERQYAGLNLSGVMAAVALASRSAWATRCRARWGSVDGETSNCGPVAATPSSIPEYREASWNYPDGRSLDRPAAQGAHPRHLLDAARELRRPDAGRHPVDQLGNPYGAHGQHHDRAATCRQNLGYRNAPASVLVLLHGRTPSAPSVSFSTDMSATLHVSRAAAGQLPALREGRRAEPVQPGRDRQPALPASSTARADQRAPRRRATRPSIRSPRRRSRACTGTSGRRSVSRRAASRIRCRGRSGCRWG